MLVCTTTYFHCLMVTIQNWVKKEAIVSRPEAKDRFSRAVYRRPKLVILDENSNLDEFGKRH